VYGPRCSPAAGSVRHARRRAPWPCGWDRRRQHPRRSTP